MWSVLNGLNDVARDSNHHVDTAVSDNRNKTKEQILICSSLWWIIMIFIGIIKSLDFWYWRLMKHCTDIWWFFILFENYSPINLMASKHLGWKYQTFYNSKMMLIFLMIEWWWNHYVLHSLLQCLQTDQPNCLSLDDGLINIKNDLVIVI